MTTFEDELTIFFAAISTCPIPRKEGRYERLLRFDLHAVRVMIKCVGAK